MATPFMLSVLVRRGLLQATEVPDTCIDAVSERRLLQGLVDRGLLNWDRVFGVLEDEWAIPWKREPDWPKDWSERLSSAIRAAARQHEVVVHQVTGHWEVIANHPAGLAGFSDSGVLGDDVWEAFLCLELEGGSAPIRPVEVQEVAPQSHYGDPLQQLLLESSDASITDIHLEPMDGGGGRSRRRIDGRMLEHGEWAAPRWERLMASLLHRAHLPADRLRFPQEAHLEEGQRRFRVSLIPALHGTAAVLRQLPVGQASVDLEGLGMEAAMARRWRDLMTTTQGLLLVVGPTGAGKSTTVRALLRAADPSRRKILSLEDPVENRVVGVQQVAVGSGSAVSFSEGIRSALRQCPDILFIGEIRDAESATAALEASLTGHLVISTIHARSLVGAVWRLRELGLTAVDLASQLSALITQRLIRLGGGGRRAVFADWLLESADRDSVRSEQLPIAEPETEFAEALSAAQAKGIPFEKLVFG